MTKTSAYKIGILFAACTSFCWAVLAIVLKYALDFIDSGSIVWFRMCTAAFFSILFFSIKNPQQLKIFRKPPRLAVIAALCLAANYFSYMKGLELTSVSNTQIMIQLATVFLILAGIFYFKESLSLLQWAGLLTAFYGFTLFYSNQLVHFADNMRTYFYGNLWIVFASATWALFAVLQKKLSQIYSPQQLNILTYAVAALSLSALADFGSLAQLSGPQWMVLVALGFNTIIAYGCLGEALKRAPASYVGFVIALDPLLTLLIIEIMDVYSLDIIAHEPLHLRDYIGALLVAIGISCALLMSSSKK